MNSNLISSVPIISIGSTSSSLDIGRVNGIKVEEISHFPQMIG
jgi:hypothetical protein